MAKRKTGITPADCERWRSKIQVGNIIYRLGKVANGEVDCSTAQMKAAEILLRKSLPDLSSLELTGDLGANVVFTWADEKSRKSKG